MTFQFHTYNDSREFDAVNRFNEAKQFFILGDFEGALTSYERAFSSCGSCDSLKQKISEVVFTMINDNLIPGISFDEQKKIFPQETFTNTGQSVKTLYDLIEWKQGNGDMGLESSLEIARWYNALGDLKDVNRICNLCLLSSAKKKTYEFLLEKAIAHLQAEDFQGLKAICQKLDSSIDSEIIRYTKIIRREAFLRQCLQLVQSWGR